MTEAVVLQIAVPAAIAVAGAGWAIIRYELGRYAKAHPTAPIVKDAEAVIAEAKAIAPVLGVTPAKVAGFISGALAASGHPVPAAAVLATEQAVAAAATADLAAVTPAAAPATPPAVAPVTTPPAVAQQASQTQIASILPAQAPTPAAPTL